MVQCVVSSSVSCDGGKSKPCFGVRLGQGIMTLKCFFQSLWRKLASFNLTERCSVVPGRKKRRDKGIREGLWSFPLKPLRDNVSKA